MNGVYVLASTSPTLANIVVKLWMNPPVVDDLDPFLEPDRLVAVYIELRRRGIMMPVERLGKIVKSSVRSVKIAKQIIASRKLFTIQPDPPRVRNTLIELGVPEDIAVRAVGLCMDVSRRIGAGWYTGILAGCLNVFGLPKEQIADILGVAPPTTRKYVEKVLSVLSEIGLNQALLS